MTTDDSNNPDSHDTPSDHDEPISATPDNINSKISEEEKEISLDGFGSASITSTSPDEDDDEDVNAYYRDQIIARENEKYTPANTGSQGNGNGHENANRQRSELEFELTLKLKQAGIVKRFAYYAKTNAIQVLLSHHYDNKSIVFSVYKKDWNKTHSIFEKRLKQKGVSKEHILQFLDVLDSNYDAILGLCSLDSQSTGSYSDDSDDKIQQQNTPAIIAAAEAFLAEDENEEQVKEEEAIIIDPSKDLDPYILDQDRDYAENVIKTAKKTVKQEDALVRQIVYTGLSAYTNEPINLGIIAPTSEGKTYPVIECMNLFPKDDKWLIGKMSTKMLVRQKGVLVDENNEPLKPKIKDIKYQIKQAEQDGDTEHVQDLRDQLAALYERSRTLIELKGKILVFLEPPEHELWNLLKPILSHDSDEIEFPFVDKTERGFEAKRIVVKGWPACIFCSAKDESNWSVWPEIVSRALITSPNMNAVKYRESNLLIAQRKGLPSLIQQQIILSDNESRLAELCILYLKQQITTLLENMVIKYSSDAHKHNNNPVWLPYFEILAEALPGEKGSDNRIAKRIFSLIQIIAFTKAHLRNKLVLGPDTLIIASLEDLGQVLYITQNLSGMPAFKLQKFKEWLVPLFKSKKEPNRDIDSKGNPIEEKVIGLTTKQMCDSYKQRYGKAITSDNLKKTYVYELMHNGYIDEQDSVIDKRQKIYFPIIEIDDFDNNNHDNNNNDKEKMPNYTNRDHSYNFMQYSRLKLPKYFKDIPGDWLKFEVLDLLKYRIDPPSFSILDEKNNQICICKFVEKYGTPSRYFSKADFKGFRSNFFGEMKFFKQFTAEEYEKLQEYSKFVQFGISSNFHESSNNAKVKEQEQSETQNQAQIASGNLNDTLHTLQGPYSDYPSVCYYCDYKPDSKDDYETHVVMRHSHSPAYPNKAEIEKRGLKAQGKDWEI